VGGNAQIKSMKKIAGTLKLDQAQYRELEAFSKFGSDLDASTKSTLEKGVRNVEILKQGQYSPIPVEKQIAIIYLGTKGLLRDVPVKRIKEFENEYVALLDAQHRPTLDALRKGTLDDSITSVLENVAAGLTPKYKI
jgi:F-type H+-transporting ATPase subunit alpha